MKRIFYLSGTLFFLSLTLLVGVHIGQTTAIAQKVKTQEVTVATSIRDLSGQSNHNWVIMTNGDVYDVVSITDGAILQDSFLIGNVFGP